ncbi:MAG: efflux RND transporter permease subunit [Terriglobia bacterium]|nr:efflux RND transporter permease subunit [Terriglobia bacterium]
MNIPELFLKRPITTTLLTSSLLVFGIAGYRKLPVNDLPNIDYPTIQVTATLPGASPETMASAVATPLEKQLSTVPGIDSMNSTNSLGSTSITIQLDLSRSVDGAAQDVQSAIANAIPQLPAEMPTPPTYQKVNPAESPILYLAVHSPTLSMSDVDEIAETSIAERMSMVKGVAEAQVYGSRKYALRVRADPYALASRQIGIDDLANAIKTGNVNLPIGALNTPGKAYAITANGQLSTAKQFRQLIVAYRNGGPVHLGEVANVVDGVENEKLASWFNGEPAIVLTIMRQPGANTVEITDKIRALLPEIQRQLPQAVKVDVLYDESSSIRESLSEVKFTLLLTIGLVILVILIFLRRLAATFIAATSIPVSIVGTFGVMWLLGFSLDNLSLMALTLSVGFVVDDAVVMLENIVRHIEAGMPLMQAALTGSREITFTIISMTLSLAAVFIPVLFMGGVIGRLLHEFAITIAFSILMSGIVSLTLTPMLCGRLLGTGTLSTTLDNADTVFERSLRIYSRSLGFVMRHKLSALFLSILLLAVTFLLAFGIPGGVARFMPHGMPDVLVNGVPKGFLPTVDTGQMFAFTQAAEGISFQDMIMHQKEVDSVIANSGYAQGRMSTVGGGGINTSNNLGRIFMHLRPRGERPGANAIIQELRPKLTQIPGIKTFLQILPPIRIGGMLTKSEYQYTLQSVDLHALYYYVPLLERALRRIPELEDVTSDLAINSPQLNVQIDRNKAAALGVSPEQAEQSLYSAFGPRQVSTIYGPSDEYKVLLDMDPSLQTNPDALSTLYLHSASGALVPIRSVAQIQLTRGPLTIMHFGQLPSVTLSFNLRRGSSLSSATREVEEVASQILPATITHGFQGTAQAFTSSTSRLMWLLIATVGVIYVILGILYESVIHPITILSGLPSAGIGALLALLLFRLELNLYSFVGIILLVGIVKKNAIMMIDCALREERYAGKSPEEAIMDGALVRFRPIMMTTVAAIFGALPLALGIGAGSEARRPLGVAVVGGLLCSQLLTLYMTPIYYVYLAKAIALLRRSKDPVEAELTLGSSPNLDISAD